MKGDKRKKKLEINKKSETIKNNENQEERKIQSLFTREKEVKTMMLARQHMYIHHLMIFCFFCVYPTAFVSFLE